MRLIMGRRWPSERDCELYYDFSLVGAQDQARSNALKNVPERL